MGPADAVTSTAGGAVAEVGEPEEAGEAGEIDASTDGEADETGDPGEGDDDGELQVIIDGEPTESDDTDPDGKPAPNWLKELRHTNREKTRENRRLQEQIEQLKRTSAPAVPVTLGEKPTLESCDYDATKLATELDAWYARKAEVDAQQAEVEKKAKAEAEQWQGKLAAYGNAAKELKVKDFADAEDTVKDALSVTQQGIIVHGADNPALVVYALGKNPKKAAELAAIADPVKFAFEVAKLEAKLKVKNTRTPPAPEGRVRSTVAGAASVDNQLEKLRAEAEKTGDYSKVTAFKRQQRERQAA